MSARLSHLNDKGEARMVDVSEKTVTTRTAIAEGFVSMSPATLDMILDGTAPKGDVLATARIAGITGAKKTADQAAAARRSVEVRYAIASAR